MKLLLAPYSKSITAIHYLIYIESIHFTSEERYDAVIVGVNTSGEITLENTTD